MPVCRQCGKEWPEGYAVCPDDGMRISAVAQQNVAAGGAGYSTAPRVAPTQSEELAPGSTAGEYRIERKLGEGGMGAVYGARHPVIGKRAAIKVIKRELSASAEAVDRFVREAQAVNQIGHPNIVDVFGFGQLDDGRSFFVMEWLEGESLRARMQQTLSLDDALEILEAIATALEAAHEAGVVHRDLKPDNVFMARQRGGQPKVKLLDFGLAKLNGAIDGRFDHTRTGVVMGTPLYLSPEQAKGVRVDFATDVYSLGAIAYEMCSGKVPFMAESAVEIMAKHISERVQPLLQVAPHTPLALDVLVTAMLEKDPARRPRIGPVREQLAAIRASLGTAVPQGQRGVALSAPVWTPQPTPTPAPAPLGLERPRSRRWLVIGGVTVVAIAAGVGGYFAMSGEGSRREGEASGQASGLRPQASGPEAKTQTPTPAPTPAEPVKVEPVKVEPVKTEPVKAELVKAEPVKPVKKPEHRLGKVVIKLDGAARGRIWIDGKLQAQGVAEATLELSAGDHKLRADAQQRLPVVQVIHVDEGGTTTVKVVLKPRPNGVMEWDDK